MKKCLRCTKQATLHITELKGGKSFSLHLCESCASEYLDTVKVGGIPDDFDSPLSIGPIGSIGSDTPVETSSQDCPICGISYKQFRSQGRLGCPHDYVQFHDELIPLLESIHHGETQHVGKFPPKVSDDSRKQHELIRLKNELKNAIDEEAYEHAAELRDEIEAIENEMKSSAKQH
ncbi:UvrB/UvrC motif-containing protein [Planctomicrobium sp.]|jgi:protein arginine kinase activator|nr:UvrB/UvrC motif-containing protein [Planctomicrobium sp.]MBT5017118.1 DNA helicase UvrBC [Planctomicrobium sp.]MDA7503743.1 UvrB/UvrC motif-containing protein [bacterium]MDB4743174.1 UvrB/UvrC motif-containing protein [Planctomicrobium sp.]